MAKWHRPRAGLLEPPDVGGYGEALLPGTSHVVRYKREICAIWDRHGEEPGRRLALVARSVGPSNARRSGARELIEVGGHRGFATR